MYCIHFLSDAQSWSLAQGGYRDMFLRDWCGDDNDSDDVLACDDENMKRSDSVSVETSVVVSMPGCWSSDNWCW